MACDEESWIAEELWSRRTKLTHDEFVKTTIRCAMNKRYHPARDENGKPIAGVTAPWPVHYKTYGAEVQE